MKLAIHNCSAHIGSTAVLEDVTFSLLPNELLCVIGPSGAGKTSLLRCVAGLQKHTGSIMLNGSELHTVPIHQRQIGFVDQQLKLFPHLTVFENVAYPLRLRKVEATNIRTQVLDILNEFDIAHTQSRLPQQLSGGEQQRVAFARALIYKPQLLLLDEPFASLDPIRKYEMVAWLRNILIQRPIPTLFVTHNIKEAQSLSDRAVFLQDGAQMAIGTWAELVALNELVITEFMNKQI